MSSDVPLGKDVLVEVGMSYVEGIMPTIDPRDYDRLATTLADFLDDRIKFADASRVFMETTGRDEPLIRVKEILTIPDDPIPYTEEARTEDNHNRKKTRTWSAYEDQRLVAGVYRYGLDNWPMVASFVGNGRTRAQCTQRWTRGLNPKICKKHWTAAEDEQLKRLVQRYGEKAWTKIAAALGNRSDVQCRYHYRQISRGDEMQGTFMSLGRNGALVQSANAFYNSQFRPIVTQPVYVVPAVVVPHEEVPVPPQPQPVFGPPPVPPSALAMPVNPLRLSYNVLPSYVRPKQWESVQNVAPIPVRPPVPKAATVSPSATRNEKPSISDGIDNFLSHFK